MKLPSACSTCGRKRTGNKKTCLRCRRYQKRYHKEHREERNRKKREYHRLHPEIEKNRVRDWSFKDKSWKYKRKYVLKKRYNMTLQEFDRLMDRQLGACAICEFKPKKGRLHVDHCHKSGKIRGLLCRFCNSGLGMFKDNRKVMRKAISYLRERA